MFLDEIGELPLELQPKLLRVLQMKEVTPVGSTEAYPVDVQVLAATNRDLDAAVEAGEFREDLLCRLNTVHLAVPPLWARPEDIPRFVAHFSDHFAREYGRPAWRPDAETLERFVRQSWPGNVRQLAQTIQRLYVFGDRIDSVLAELFATDGHRGKAAALLGVSLNTMTRLVSDACPELTTTRGRRRSVKPR